MAHRFSVSRKLTVQSVEFLNKPPFPLHFCLAILNTHNLPPWNWNEIKPHITKNASDNSFQYCWHVCQQQHTSARKRGWQTEEQKRAESSPPKWWWNSACPALSSCPHFPDRTIPLHCWNHCRGREPLNSEQTFNRLTWLIVRIRKLGWGQQMLR